MERHIQKFLNKLSFTAVTVGTLILFFLLLHTPDTCVDRSSPTLKPHHQFPKSSCDAAHRSLTSLEKRNRRLWSSKAWRTTVSSFSSLFRDLRTLDFLSNDSRVLCVSAGAGHEVMALHDLGVGDVTGVELVDSPPLVTRADPLNLPFFDGTFDLGFSAHFDQALFPSRFAAEMERTVRVGGIVVLAVEESGDQEVKEIAKLFRRSQIVGAKTVTLIGSRTTQITLRIILPS